MSTAVATSLIERLKEIQAREGLSGNEFARRLGISPQLYHMTKTSKRDIGLEVLKAIAKAYPELNRDVLIFLGSDVSILANLTTDLSTTPSETSQNGKLRALSSLAKGFIHRLKSFVLFNRAQSPK